jgi:hypothetical protein
VPTADVIVADVKAQGGFDVDDATIYGLLNEVHKEVVGAAKWLEAIESLGATVAGVATYDLADSIVDVASINIDPGDGTGPGDWRRVGVREIWDLQGGRSFLRGAGGVFSPYFKADGTKQLALYPVPTLAGLAITGLVALIPSDLVAGQSPVIPEDMHARLKDGVISLGLMRLENRNDLAASFEQRKDAMAGELARRKNSRVGSEPTRMLVEGYDFR